MSNIKNFSVIKLPNGHETKHAKKPSLVEVFPEERPDYENYVHVGRKYYPAHYTHADTAEAVDGSITRTMALNTFGFTQTYGELYDQYVQKLRATNDDYQLEFEENSPERAWIRNSDPNIRSIEEVAVEEGIYTQLNAATNAHDFNAFDADYFAACNEIDNYLNNPCQ